MAGSSTPSAFLPSSRSNRRLRTNPIGPVARLFGPAIFEASKLKVLYLAVDHQKHHLPRTYTLTHSDVTANLTLAISKTINGAQFQGWYNKFYRDEVVAEWKKLQGKMSLHVHCHVSGGHFLLDFLAKLRYWIFSKELPVVLKAFVHGDINLFSTYPELEEASVWVYFHSNHPEYNKVECWGPLREAASGNPRPESHAYCPVARPRPCDRGCSCCFPHDSAIPWVHKFDSRLGNSGQLQHDHCHELDHQI